MRLVGTWCSAKNKPPHSHIFSLLSPDAFGVFFPLLLKCVILEAVPLLLICWALDSGTSVLEPAVIDFTRHGGSFWQLLTESIPLTSTTIKKKPQKTQTYLYLSHESNENIRRYDCSLQCILQLYIFSHLIDSGNYWWSIILRRNNIMFCQVEHVHTMEA